MTCYPSCDAPDLPASVPSPLSSEHHGVPCCTLHRTPQVGQDVLLTLPAKRGGGGGEPQRRVRVLVRSEGPTRVLTVLDVQRHRCVGVWVRQVEGEASVRW